MPQWLQGPCQFQKMAEMLGFLILPQNFLQDECHVLGKFTNCADRPVG
jgi:hypothetical protein